MRLVLQVSVLYQERVLSYPWYYEVHLNYLEHYMSQSLS